jgi:tetratricopeptide (TPR) repeat protein
VSERPESAKAHFYLGVCHENLGAAEAAKEQYKLAIGYDANLAEAHNNLGNLLLEQGDLVHAEAELHSYLKQRPDESAAHYNYGLVLEAMGKRDSAREQYAKAAELDPEDAAPIIGLADLERTSGNDEAALELYRRARKVAPKDPVPVLNEGQVLLGLKRLDEAVEVLVSLATMSDADAPTTTTGGMLLARYDEDARAMELYRSALERDETYPLAHLLLANALARGGAFADAATHFERFLELAPEAPEAPAARKGLEVCRAQAGQ